MSLSPAATVFHAETGEDIVLHNAVNQPSDVDLFLARLRALVDEYELNG